MVATRGPQPEDGAADVGGPDLFEAEPKPTAARGWRRVLVGATLVTAAVIAVNADDSDGSGDRLRTSPPPPTSTPTGTTQPQTVELFSADIGLPQPIDLDDGRSRQVRPDTSGRDRPAEQSTPPDTPTPPIAPRPIPIRREATDPSAPAPPWAVSTRTTSAGFVATDIGCADGTGAADLDELFAGRMGPVIGLDYQHVYPLGEDRYLWLFQDTFVDHPGVADRLGEAAFVHNAAMVQDGTCFTLFHRGTAGAATSFEPGAGEDPLSRWFWPMGGELVDGALHVFWVEMIKDDTEPAPGDGLGWHPSQTWLAVYDAETLARLEFVPAPNSGVSPIYGYAVASDGEHTYLFGNTFDQNLTAEGGFFGGGDHSATAMWLARVPRGQLLASPEYRTADGWSDSASAAVAILERGYVENPMQPRHLVGQWVAATKVDGYWGDTLAIDVAIDPWGPWTTVGSAPIGPRSGDPLMNTYHAHLMPWVDDGSVVVSLSQNARDMLRDAWPRPDRYRPRFLSAELVPPPRRTSPTTTTSTPTSPPTTRATTTTSDRPNPSTTNRPPTTDRPNPTTTDGPTTTNRPPNTSTSTSSPTSSSSSTTSSSPSTAPTVPPTDPTPTSTVPCASTTTSTSTSGPTTSSSTTTTTTTTMPGASTTTSTTMPPCPPDS